MKKKDTLVIAGAVLLLMVGNLLLLGQCGSASPGAKPDGPGMIYFYSPV